MSITNQENKFSYTLLSTTETLAFPTLFFNNADLQVIRTRLGIETFLQLNSDYTVSGAGVEGGGSITLLGTNVQVGDQITILRIVELTQQVDFVNHDRFPASVHEKALDKLTMAVQQIDEENDRSIKIARSDSGNVIVSPADTRANKVLSFDSLGNVVTTLDAQALQLIIEANPVATLSDSVDYGDLTTPTESVDYGDLSP